MPWQRETIDSSMVTAHHRSSRTRRLGLLKSLVGGCLALVAICAHAWGAAAHRLIAEAAYGQLSPAARAAVDDLLALEPGATFESISTWADEVRSPGTGPWHYVNLPRDSGCMYGATRDCPDGRCVVGAIERQTAVLSSGAQGAERLKALKYLVHFVADIHQPLHAGYGDDRGGNLYQVRFNGRGTNLHAMWDVGLIEAWPGGVAALRASVMSGAATTDGAADVAAWAEESCRIVSAPGFYPDGHILGTDYVERAAPVVVDRLQLAGRRLAATLNLALARNPPKGSR
jgi:hypothetical protein